MSSTIEPRASCTGRPAPTAAAIGSRHDVDAARAGAFGRLLDRAALDLRGAERHAHQHPRAGAQEAVAVHLLDEVLQHLLGVGEVRDDAVLHRTHRGDVARGAAQHVLGFHADRDDDLAAARRFVLHCDDRRLVEHDAALAHVDQRVGGSKIDREVIGEITSKAFEHGVFCCAKGGEKSCANVTTDRTFSKATCIINRAYFCALARIFDTPYEPDPSRRRKDRAPRAPVDHRTRDAGLRHQLVEHRRLRRASCRASRPAASSRWRTRWMASASACGPMW